MEVLHTIRDAREAIRRAKAGGREVGFVPTMGALHEGHLALVRRARAESGFVAVSIFVNPTQFGPGEDFERYPRTLAADSETLQSEGVDIVFAPAASEMYPDGFDTWIDIKGLTEVLEGRARPGHFRGVTTVCAKLFNIVKADRAYFGTKDYQQLKVIQKMVRELDMPLSIVPVQTVREPDGLALSSRNRYLSPDERSAALVLSRSLWAAREAYEKGERDAAGIQDVAANLIKAEPLAGIDYVAVVDAETLGPLEKIDSPAVVLLAVRIGATRLIDNTILNFEF